MAFEKFTSEHPYLTFFLGIAAIHGVVTLIRGHQPIHCVQSPPDLFGGTRPLHPAASRLQPRVGAFTPGMDYSFTRRPGYDDKNY